MRILRILTVLLLLFTTTASAGSNVKQAYENASLDFVSALVSMAAYSDQAGAVARAELARSGWSVRVHTNRFSGLEARFLVMDNFDMIEGKEIYILAVTGTENASDFKIDLNFSKVFFGGRTPEEFAASAQRRDLTSKDPMVHRGFNQYAQTAFFSPEEDGETYGEFLAGFLREKENRILYMTGHSLGGAVAAIGASRLLRLGVNPEQIRVVTFGMPAIGNAAFAAQYGAALPIRRIVLKNDPVRGVLQSIAGGYTQFGEQEICQERDNVYHRPHSIGVYVDAMMRKYYDARRELAAATGNTEEAPLYEAGAAKVYIAPVEVEAAAEVSGDIDYIREAITDSLRSSLSSGFVVAQESGDLPEDLARAKASGCKWLLRAGAAVKKDRNRRDEFYVEYQETIYDVESGAFKHAAAHSQGTRRFTPLQAALHDSWSVREQRLQALGMK